MPVHTEADVSKQELRSIEAVHPPEVLDRLEPSLERLEGRPAYGLYEVVSEVGWGLLSGEPHRLGVVLREIVATLREALHQGA
eukprot:12605523-Alexandrium_andersonii.AAC.1